MDIKFNHVEDFEGYTNVYLSVSTKDDDNYFEKLFHLTEETGRHLVLQCMKEKWADGSYSACAFVQGAIFDNNGGVSIVPNRMFSKEELTEVNEWLNEHEEEWVNELNSIRNEPELE